MMWVTLGSIPLLLLLRPPGRNRAASETPAGPD